MFFLCVGYLWSGWSDGGGVGGVFWYVGGVVGCYYWWVVESIWCGDCGCYVCF